MKSWNINFGGTTASESLVECSVTIWYIPLYFQIVLGSPDTAEAGQSEQCIGTLVDGDVLVDFVAAV
jgi:hypothetical protein